jgi:hypothetical protein
LDEAPCLARFDSFLTGSSEFFIFSGLVPGLLGVMFTSLLDLYRASRSCHEVLNELEIGGHVISRRGREKYTHLR